MAINKQELVAGDLSDSSLSDSDCKLKKNGIGITRSGRVFLIVCISCKENDIMNFSVVSIFYLMNFSNPNTNFHMGDS